MWKLTFEAPIGSRSMKGFDSVTNLDSFWFLTKQGFWSEDSYDIRLEDEIISTHDHSPKSVKAFKRYLRNHPELKGIEVILCHRQCIENLDGSTESLDVRANWITQPPEAE